MDEEQIIPWSKFGIYLALAVPYQPWKEAPWLRAVITDADDIGRQQAYRLTEEPHIEKIESAIEQWLEDGSIQTLEHPADFLFSLRFSTVGHLLSTFEGLFAPPPATRHSWFYRSFLINWWRKHGQMYAVGYTLGEDDGLPPELGATAITPPAGRY